MEKKLEAPLPIEARTSTKRTFHDRLATSQVDGRHEQALNIEDGSILPYLSPSGLQSAPSDGEDAGERQEGASSDEIHIEKRSRTSDWPLRNNANNEPYSIPRVALRDQHDALNFIPAPVNSSVKPRLSKFVEGSMNDRASQKPHQSYVSNSEQNWDRFEAEQNTYGDTLNKSQPDGLPHDTHRYVAHSVVNENSEVSRPSSIFRFGRSVAAAFNPSSWRIWSKQQEEDTSEKNILRVRRDKAEQSYKQLKQNGQYGHLLHGSQLRVDDKSMPYNNKHDSGVDVEPQSSVVDALNRTSSRIVEVPPEERRYGRVFLEPLELPPLSTSDSPTVEVIAASRDLFSQTQEPTLQTGETLSQPKALRRLPSRKDLQKQQKLVKRVSDLEGKLEAARRQLAEATGEPIPAQVSSFGRARFIPHTLASLPSERLLGGFAAPESRLGDHHTTVGVKNANYTDNQMSSVALTDMGSDLEEKRYDAQVLVAQMEGVEHLGESVDDAPGNCVDNLMSSIQATSKRKSFPTGVTNGADEHKLTGATDNESGGGFENAKLPVQKRRPGRPRKNNSVNSGSTVHTVEPTESRKATPKASVEIGSSHLSRSRITKLPNSRRLIVRKQAASSASNSRIPRQGSCPRSPPPLSFYSTSGHARREEETGHRAEQNGERDNAIGVVTSSDVPPVPALPRTDGLQKSVPASYQKVGSGPNVAVCNKVNSEKRALSGTNTGGGKNGAEGGPDFEWPADVF